MLVLALSTAPAGARIEIEGSTEAVSLVVDDASLGDVLAALATRFAISYRLPPQWDRPAAGTYSGTLHDVVVRVIDGYDYVVITDDERMEIKLWGRGRSGAQSSLSNPMARMPRLPIPPQLMGDAALEARER